MSERRKHDRRAQCEEFYCWLGGQRMDSESMDISPGGAFLAADPAPPILSLVIIVPKQGHRVQSGIALVGAVRREQSVPVPGVGIEWLRCISRYGYEDVAGFLTHFLECPPQRLPVPSDEVLQSPVAAYNFRADRYYVPDIPASGMSESTPTLPDAELTQEDVLGPLNSVLNDGVVQTHFTMPVRLVIGDICYDVLTRQVGTRTIEVSRPAEVAPGEGMAILHFPIPLRKETTWVRLLCALVSGTDPKGEWLDLSIVEMLHEKNPGIFERFVRYLHERAIPTGGQA